MAEPSEREAGRGEVGNRLEPAGACEGGEAMAAG